jgi:FkbM family methyltransferase
LILEIKQKVLKIVRKVIHTKNKLVNSESDRELSLFKTSTGDYYLPSRLPSDEIINQIKKGKVFDSEVVEVAKQYITEGSTVLDVGANFGQMTVIFSSCAGQSGKVFSFEADDFIYSVLQKNIALNHRDNITAICKAVYNKSGDTMFYPVQDFKRFETYGSYGLNPNVQEGRKVETITIDSLKIDTPISFMKVDVQGSDLFVLQGAVETIAQHQMPIIFEYEEQFQSEFNTCWQDYLNFIDLISYKIERVVDGINYLIVPKSAS